MELQLIKRPFFLAIMVFTLSACSDELLIVDDPVDERFRESTDTEKSLLLNEIRVESDEYSILTIADIHVGTANNLDHFLKVTQMEKPVAVVIDGDLTGGLHNDYDNFEKHFPQNDSLKTFYVVGNHDLWHDGWSEFYSRFGSSIYFFTVTTTANTDLYICLDTGSGTLGKLQTEWLRNILELNRPAFRRCVVITHVNLFRSRKTESTNPVVEELAFLIDLFAENKVDMVITGHDHKSDVQMFGPTTYLQVDALEDNYDSAGYLLISVKNGTLDYRFKKI